MHPPYCFAPGKKLTSSVPVKKGAVSLFALRDTMSTATANKIETSTGDPRRWRGQGPHRRGAVRAQA